MSPGPQPPNGRPPEKGQLPAVPHPDLTGDPVPEWTDPADFRLSDFGEGYCRVCRFVLGLREDGTLSIHHRAAGTAAATRCGGSGMKPGPRIPKTSRKNAFSTIPKYVTCPFCLTRVTIRFDWRISVHEEPNRWPRLSKTCRGSNTDSRRPPVEGAPESNERGEG